MVGGGGAAATAVAAGVATLRGRAWNRARRAACYDRPGLGHPSASPGEGAPPPRGPTQGGARRRVLVPLCGHLPVGRWRDPRRRCAVDDAYGGAVWTPSHPPRRPARDGQSPLLLTVLMVMLLPGVLLWPSIVGAGGGWASGCSHRPRFDCRPAPAPLLRGALPDMDCRDGVAPLTSSWAAHPQKRKAHRGTPATGGSNSRRTPATGDSARLGGRRVLYIKTTQITQSTAPQKERPSPPHSGSG